MAAKRKQFSWKVASRLSRYNAGQKFRQNRSISLCFPDKQVFAFNAEIQDGCQKWRENDFCKKWPVNSTDTLRVKNFIEITLSRSVSEINVFFALNTEIQDGHQKWREKQFCKNSPVDSADTLWVKNFVKIALPRSVSAINMFHAEIQDGHQKWRENVFCKKAPVESKFRRNCSISLSFWDKCVFTFSALREIVMFSWSLISRPLCNGSIPKVNDFQTSI